jgi:hypothetical protein
MLEDSNVFGVSFDQLAPLVNRLVWEKQIQEKKSRKKFSYIDERDPNSRCFPIFSFQVRVTVSSGGETLDHILYLKTGNIQHQSNKNNKI